MSEIQDLVDALALEIGSSVAIDDQRFHLAVFSSHSQDVDEVRRASILSRESPPRVCERLEELGVQNALGPMRIAAIPEFGMRARVCVPLRFKDLLLGYLWLVDSDGGLGEEELAASKEAAARIAPLIYRERIIDDRARERERQCVSGLLDSDPVVRAEVAEEALEEAVIVAAGAYGVVALQSRLPPDDHLEERAVLVEATLERVRRTMRPHACVVGLRGSRGALIAAVSPGAEGPRELSRIARRLWEDICAAGGERERWLIGLGPTADALDEVELCFSAALDALRIAEAIPGFGEVVAWQDLGAWRILARLPSDDRVRAAMHPGLAKLALLRDGDVLLHTLERYLDNAGDAQATAAEMYVHRTSLYGRLRRIERETGIDLSSGEARLSLHIGLRLRRLLQPNQGLGLLSSEEPKSDE